MDFKKIKVSANKLNDVLEFESNFGWKKDKYDKNVLLLSRDINKKYVSKLNKLERDVKKAKKHFPFGAFVMFLLAGAVLFFRFKFFDTIDFSFLGTIEEFVVKYGQYVLYVIAGIFAVIGISNLCYFIYSKVTKKRVIEEKIELAKEYTGAYCRMPIKSCIKDPGPESNILSTMNL